MRKLLTVLFCLGVKFCALAQGLTMTDLMNLCNKSNWQEVNETLISKGWSYFDSSAGDESHYSTITWAYELGWNNRAQAWFYVYIDKDMRVSSITYQFFNEKTNQKVIQGLSANHFKRTESDIQNGKVTTNYANSKFLLETQMIHQQDEEDTFNSATTIYHYTLIKKFSIDDPNNGKKKIYWLNGNIRKEYTLTNGEYNGDVKTYDWDGNLQSVEPYVNGKVDGLVKIYHANGILKSLLNYKNNKREGMCKWYTEEGLPEALINYVHDKKQGVYTTYIYQDSLVIKQSGIHNNDLLEGLQIIAGYKNDTLLTRIEANYKKGKQNGKQTTYAYGNNQQKIRAISYYVNDSLHGPCHKIEGGTIIYCNYDMGVLDGKYKEYSNVLWMLIPSEATLDTIEQNLCLTQEGEYCQGVKCGYWRTYWPAPNFVISEGAYVNNEKNGIWKTYCPNYFHVKDAEFYQGKLMRTETYKNGILHGMSDSYFTIQDSVIDNNFISIYYEEGVQKSIVARDSIDGELIFKAYLADNQTHGYCVYKELIGYSRGKCEHNKRVGLWEYYSNAEPDLDYAAESSLTWKYKDEKVIEINNKQTQDKFEITYKPYNSTVCECKWTHINKDTTIISNLEISLELLYSIPKFPLEFFSSLNLNVEDMVKFSGETSITIKDQYGVKFNRIGNRYYGSVLIFDYQEDVLLEYYINSQKLYCQRLFSGELYSGTYQHGLIEDNKVYVIESIRGGQRHGKIKEFDKETKRLIKESSYRKGVLHGKTTYYNTQNIRTKIEKYKNGILIDTKYY